MIRKRCHGEHQERAVPLSRDTLLAGQEVPDSTRDHDPEEDGLFNSNGFDSPAGQERRQFSYNVFQVRQFRHTAWVILARRHGFREPCKIYCTLYRSIVAAFTVLVGV